MRVFAHRGCPNRGPENTVAAVRRAAPHIDAVEVDVRRCGSGELVVFHDERLSRLLSHPDGATARGRVARTDWKVLSTLRVDDSDQRVPLFSEMVDAVGDLDIAFNVELKECGLAADAVADLERFDGEVLVSSFDPAVLLELRTVADYPVALIVTSRLTPSRSAPWRRGLSVAADLDAAAIHPSYGILLGAVDTAARVREAHDAGLAVNTWTIRSAEPVGPLRAAGVDGLFVDDWAYLE